MEEEQVIIIFLSLLLVIGLCLIPKLEKEQIRPEVQAKVDKMLYEAAFPLHKYMEVDNGNIRQDEITETTTAPKD